MSVIIVFGVLAVVLFLAAFWTRRRFGLLGLALAAGSILSGIWDDSAGLIVSATGLIPEGPISQAVTLSILVLLPPVLLLFHGTTYNNMFPRILGAALFSLLALAFLVQPLGHALPLQGFGVEVYRWIDLNRVIIISIGIVVAVFDLFLTKPAHLSHRHKKH